MTIETPAVPAKNKGGRPRIHPLPETENPDRGKAGQAVPATVFPTYVAPLVKLPEGTANVWHRNKFDSHTYAMVIPIPKSIGLDRDVVYFLVRTDMQGAGTGVAIVSLQMSVADALATLNDGYIQTTRKV